MVFAICKTADRVSAHKRGADDNNTRLKGMTMLSQTTINMAERRGLILVNRIEDAETLPIKTGAERVEVLDIGTETESVLYVYTGSRYQYVQSTIEDGDFPANIRSERELRKMLADFAAVLTG